MADLIANIIFSGLDEFSLIPINTSYKYIIASNPLVLDPLDNIVGVAVGLASCGAVGAVPKFKIYYSTNYYGPVTIRILEKSILAEVGIIPPSPCPPNPCIPPVPAPKITNLLPLDAETNRELPQYTFILPSNAAPISFGEAGGIYVKMDAFRGTFGLIPLTLDPGIPVTVTTSRHLYYDPILNEIRFYPTEEKGYTGEWVRIVPQAIPSSLGQIYTLGYNSSNIVYTLDPVFLHLKTPVSIKTDPYSYSVTGTFYAPFDLPGYKVTTLLACSVLESYDPVSYTLNNYNSYFSLDSSSGKLVTSSSAIPQDTAYPLSITVSNLGGELINVTINVFVYDILSDSYLRRLKGDNVCNDRRHIRMQVYPCSSPSDSLYNHVTFEDISNLRFVLNAIIRAINFVFYHVMTPNFRLEGRVYASPDLDMRALANAFVSESESEYRGLLRSKIPSLDPSSLLAKKIDLFVCHTYPFFLQVFKSYTVKDYKTVCHKLSMEYGHVIIN